MNKEQHNEPTQNIDIHLQCTYVLHSTYLIVSKQRAEM